MKNPERFNSAQDGKEVVRNKRESIEDRRQALESQREAIMNQAREKEWLGDVDAQIEELQAQIDDENTPYERKLELIDVQSELLDQQAQTAESVDDFLSQRPTEEEYTESDPREWLKDDTEKRDVHEEFLQNASFEELASATRSARENQYEPQVATEIMAVLQKRVREQEKYDILDDENGIKDDMNHPMINEYYNALRELNEEMSMYYAQSEPSYSGEEKVAKADTEKNIDVQTDSDGYFGLKYFYRHGKKGDSDPEDFESQGSPEENVANEIITKFEDYKIEDKILGVEADKDSNESDLEDGEKQDAPKTTTFEEIAEKANHKTSVEKDQENDTESAPEATPESSEELDEESTEEDEGEESKLSWREKRKIKKEAREELKKRRRELKGRMKVARQMDSKSQIYEERKNYLNELNELKNSDLYEKAGNRAKVYSFYDDKMIAVGDIRNLRYDRKSEIEESNKLFNKQLIELNEEKGQIDRKEFSDRLDKIRVEREERNKVIKSKYSTLNYLKSRKATESSSDAEQEDR